MASHIQRLRRQFLPRWIALALCLIAACCGQADELPAWSPALERIFSGKAPDGAEDLLAMEAYIQALSKKARAATVSIRYGAAHGSGVIISPDGLVLTAAHVTTALNTGARVRMADGREVRAVTLGRHNPLDASMLKLQANGPWPYLPVGKSNNLRRGQWCIATGHPGGHIEDRGPVVRLGRILEFDPELIRTDCRLSGGDSGGPLVDMRGQVIGIHSRIGTSLANNLHIPISVYREHWEGLTKGNQWKGPSYLGVRGEPEANEARITQVHPGSPAARAGIRAGDVIMRFGGQRVFAFEQLPQLVQMRRPGEDVELEIQREGLILTFDVRIGRNPDADEE